MTYEDFLAILLALTIAIGFLGLTALWSHCGAARFAYNWGLDLVRQRQDERAAGLDAMPLG